MITQIEVHDGVVLNLTDADDLHTALSRWCAALERLASRTTANSAAPLLNRVAADVTQLLTWYPLESGEGGPGGNDAPVGVLEVAVARVVDAVSAEHRLGAQLDAGDGGLLAVPVCSCGEQLRSSYLIDSYKAHLREVVNVDPRAMVSELERLRDLVDELRKREAVQDRLRERLTRELDQLRSLVDAIETGTDSTLDGRAPGSGLSQTGAHSRGQLLTLRADRTTLHELHIRSAAAAVRKAARALRAEGGTHDRWYADWLDGHANSIEKGGA